MGKRLAGKSAIITGAASGIGKASALTFAREGARVVVADVTSQGAQVVSEIRAEGGEAVFFQGDLSKRAENEKLVDLCRETFGRVDILFCNAGLAVVKPITETSDDEVDRIFQINVKSIIYASRYTIPIMLEQGGGTMLFTASKNGLIAEPLFSVYCATKGAVVMLAKGLALDYASRNIRVNALCPGIIDTPMFRGAIATAADPKVALAQAQVTQPIGRLGTVQECADTALWLVSDESSFVTGVALPVDGGFTAS